MAPPAAASGGLNLGRYFSALKRYKWLIAVIVLLGTIGGVLATQFIPPKYTVGATVVVGESPDPKGPVRPQQMMNANAWREFLTSYAILDPVTKRLGLYVTPAEEGDSALFTSLSPTSDLRSGEYVLKTDPRTRRYELSVKSGREWRVVERGAIGDSVGRAVGFEWMPPADQLANRREIEFEVRTPREASVELRNQINVFLPLESRFMWLSLTGERPRMLATTLNEVLREFLVAAEGLKKRNLTDFALALEEQTEQAKANLMRLESQYEQLRIEGITQPTEQLVTVGGTTIAQNPALQDYFNQLVTFQTSQRDREALEGLVREAESRPLTVERVLSLPGLYEFSPNIKGVIDEVTTNEAALRRLKERYTDDHPLVKDLQTKITEAQTRTIPSILRASLDQIQRRENELGRRVGTAQKELRQIPVRAIREQALARERDLAAGIYADLGNRLQLAKLAEASALPDVSVLDSAVAPLRPSSNTAPMILLMVIGASLGFAILLALALDIFDKRFRYPEQATNELGLDVLGAIPTIRRTKSGATRIEDEAQLVEAFRGLRLNVRNAANGDGPVSLAISSPGPGDGKSLISSNLALAFAEAGYRTLLVDGDIRRGQLHATFGVPQRPGLVDHLSGDIAVEDIIRETSHQNLFLITCGTRRHRGPELLAADGTAKLLRALRNRFDAIIVDTAPLGAGIDPYALGAATGNMLLVLRTGKTDRKLAQAKLTTLDRLPVRLVGAVLNDIQAEGLYKYYAYLDGYGTLEEEEEPTRLVPAGGDDDTGPALPAGRR